MCTTCMQLGIPGLALDVPAQNLPLTPTEIDLGMEKDLTTGMCLRVSFNDNNDDEDYETFFCPIDENMEAENVDNVLELISKWQSKTWDFYHKPTVRLVPLPQLKGSIEDTVKCEEFEVYIWNELADRPDLYSRPFDTTPNELVFSCGYAVDCYKGDVYSKDYGYFHCEDCRREICEQNPSNGWVGQYHWISNCDRICNKCFEDNVLNDGVNEAFKDDRDGWHWPVYSMLAYFSTTELTQKGWSEDDQVNNLLIGSGMFGDHGDEAAGKQRIIDRIKQLDTEGHLCVINIDDQAIGGLGGYLTIYHKPKPSDD